MSFTRRLSRERFVAEPAMRKFELLLTRSDCAAGLDVICILRRCSLRDSLERLPEEVRGQEETRQGRWGSDIG